MTQGRKQSMGPYELLAPLGAGGMGEVFRARDTRLNRDVAIKVLPKEFASDPDRLRRFELESKTLASLNHPNILTIHDAGVQDDSPYLVSELLEGRTLREEMSGAALPLRKATEYALQIAQGLAAAHGKGIIHRDLKPENIFVTKDGRVKILDFGLAKLHESPQSASRTPHSLDAPDDPTLVESTAAGNIIGTPPYMSPEQVRGEPVDHRSDIFAFGCVFYEMLTGKRVFRRDTPVQSLNAVLTEEPPELDGEGSAVPVGLNRLIRRCLEKSPDNRLQSAKDLAFAIEDLSHSPQFREKSAPGITHRPGSLARLGALAILVGWLGFLAGWYLFRHDSPPRVSTAPSIRQLTYSGRDFSPAVSPDGRQVCFSSDRMGPMQIWLKDLTSGYENFLTDGPDNFPRFSPDGRSVLFTRPDGGEPALFRVPILKGTEAFKVVQDAISGDWSPDGRQIAFIRLPEEGGSAVYLAGVDGSAQKLLCGFKDERCTTLRWSPDGKTLATAINDSGRPQSLQLIDVRTGRTRSIKAPHPYNLMSSLAWDKAGRRLFFVQAESASADSIGSTAVLFGCNPVSGQLEKLLWCPTQARILDVLPNGNLVMDSRSSRENLKMVPINGNAGAPRSLTLGNSTDRQPAYSPDGQTIVFSSNRGGNLDLWTFNCKSETLRRLTDDPADDWDPAFSPDGRRLVWSSNRSGNFEIWIADADGSAPKQVTHDGFAAENPTMTPNGRWIVYGSTHPKTAGIWKIHPDGTGAAPLIQSPTSGNAELSPDGKLVAVRDNNEGALSTIKVVELDSGQLLRFEIQILEIKKTGAILGRLRWSPDGKSLVFLGQNKDGINGIYVQDFVPGKDTSDTRRLLVPVDPENSAESFGISPDGRFITIACWEQFFSIMVTDDLWYQ
jgi:serine/threonine protein kinase